MDPLPRTFFLFGGGLPCPILESAALLEAFDARTARAQERPLNPEALEGSVLRHFRADAKSADEAG
eukprot:4267062-Alexandrium_andersonii.AAC.1